LTKFGVGAVTRSRHRHRAQGPWRAAGGRTTLDRTSDKPKEPIMKALVYHGPGAKAWEDVPDPVVQNPTDVIVRVETTTICGTDLHILKGDVPAVTDGRILGHEGVGTITEVGAAVSTLAVGDRVIISCISACGACSYCHQGLFAHCLADEGASGIGWIFGHLIDGTQAE
jgi:alcohol dehydrogenase